MKIGLYWYSATGNTKHLARVCRDYWVEKGHEVAAFDMLNSKGEEAPAPDEFDRVVFAFPVMIFRPPFAASRFAEALPMAQRPVDAHLLITSAGMGAKADSRYASLLLKKKLIVRSAWELVCTDSYIPFRKYLKFMQKPGLPDETTDRRAIAFAANVVSVTPAARLVPWKGVARAFFAAIGDSAPHEAGKSLLGARRLELDKCVGCGLCAELCPTGSIRMVGKVPSVEEKTCVGCLACFNNCRTNAWRLKGIDLAYHYRYGGEDVSKAL